MTDAVPANDASRFPHPPAPSVMSTPSDSSSDDARPWPQKLYDSIWLLAGAAFLFFVLSYVIWGLVDILTVPTG